MSRFEMKFNEWSEHAEHDWLVFDRGVMVAGFAGSNAAERFIARREQEIAIDKAIASARRSSRVSNAEARRIHALLRGRA
jgi:hypothetical protein